jgi:thiamine-monophosphate kinase
VNEFQFIDRIRSKYALDKVGDDCAVLPKNNELDLLVTAEILVEDIDFRLEWTTPELLGHKALAVSLSDIAAMGGEPRWAMISVAVSKKIWNSDFLDRFYEGWMALARQFSVELVGGDVSRSQDKLVIDSVVGGDVAAGKAVLRSGAQPGDGIFVTGTLGGAAGGLRLLENGIRLADEIDQNVRNLLNKQLKPTPQVDTGKLLISLGTITSIIDISDGLSSDLWHLCEMGGVGAEIEADSLPVNPALYAHFSKDHCLDLALNGGEDFELVFTADESFTGSGIEGITRIGVITSDAGKIALEEDSGSLTLRPKGYHHF